MKKLKFVVSLTTSDNDYQMEQAASAEEAARRLGIEIQIMQAENDSITQSQQLLDIVQSRTIPHPDGIVFEPVGGTALPQVANAAAAAGIGWVVLNRDVEYLADLRRRYQAPVFAVTSDHEEIGRIQGRQMAALLPRGGSVLYIQGPADSLAAKQRSSGMSETKPANVQVKALRANWTEAGAYRAVSSWLRLSTSMQAKLELVCAQDDSMAVGAKKAFQDLPESAARERWMNVLFTGCDGMPKTGQAWVRRGLLAATVIVPPNTGQAMEMLMRSIQSGSVPVERTLTVPRSFPSVEELCKIEAEKSRAMGAAGASH